MASLQAAVLATALLGAAGTEGETVLLDFYADWCGPCKQMDYAVRQLIARGLPVRKVNFDQHRDVADRYGVEMLPTFVMLADGQIVDRVVGGTTLSRLEQMFRKAEAVGARNRQNPAPSATGSPSGTPPGGAIPASRAQAAVQPPIPEWRLPQSAQPDQPQPGISDDDLIAASVRIRIEDSQGHCCGTGTVVDARGGKALILSCGHLFRDAQQNDRITVDLFGPKPVEGLHAELVNYDEQRDVGLLVIDTPGPVAVANVAPPGYQVAQGDRVVSVGCDNGAPPTARHSRVTSMDRYLGPPNLQVDGLPVQGRSGGGLFSSEGFVIGVCNAADPSENEGLYAALESIHAELNRAGLSFVYRAPGDSGDQLSSVAATSPPPMPTEMPDPLDVATQRGPAARAEHGGGLTRPEGAESLGEVEQAALEEIRRRAAQGAEVICVIRSRSNPEAPSEVIMLDRVSPAFLQQLASEAAKQDERQLTSLQVPRRPAANASSGPPPVGATRPAAAAAPGPGKALVPCRLKKSRWQPQWLEVGSPRR